MPVTFEVDSKATPVQVDYSPSSLQSHLSYQLKKNGGVVIKASNASKSYIKTRFDNGFVGALITAYNQHHELVLGPDETWVAITTSLSRYINAHAEEMRDKFVNHQGQLELKAVGGGNIYSANYNDLISQISNKIDENTKGDVREWMACNFSTSTPLKKVVSKVVLMASMQKYFSYKMTLYCGLPKVTLEGKEEDWKKIRQKIEKLKEFDSTLAAWSEVIGDVIDHFVDAFSGKVDKDFWNRVAHIHGGGSGPRYLEGWALAFIAFDDNGKYILPPLSSIKQDHSYGQLLTDITEDKQL